MLHVWLRAQHSPLAVWHEDVQQWQSVAGWQQLQDIYSSYKSNSHKTVCLYFPSSHVLQVDTELNGAQLKQLGNTGKQYLFEETSLTPVEQLAIRQTSLADSQYLYALAQGDIEAWQQSAKLVGMSIAALLPDFLLLSVPEEGAGQQITLYQDDQTMLLRQSLYQGMAVSYLPLIFERFPQLSEVTVVPSIEAFDNINFSDLDATKSDPSIDLQNPVTTTDFSAQTAALIADHQLLLTMLTSTPKPIDSPERHALNFFIKSTDSQLSPYLRVAMMVALSALVLQIATDGVQFYQYNQATMATKTAITNQYQSWFPDERLNPRTNLTTQMAPKLGTNGQASPHIAVLSRISPLIKQSSLKAQSLVMQPSALSFTLIAPDRDSLDKFANTLFTQGLTAKLERVNSNEQGQFSGQITVSINEEGTTPESVGADKVAAS
ncbi:type II secretion system protein L [Psychrobacter glaciei]|uniref:Type II secretion system protein L n=1 Tax=Psychrobacter glaciei TaxID=619771 RepID=A0ABQ3GPW1_9GAMM|nr:type II secretion system protein GspL [Psychrobacter glaciei]GHD27934.1 type II secretion system protein L [Psychrobacter glaciei]